MKAIPSPLDVKNAFPLDGQAARQLLAQSRSAVGRRLRGAERRPLVVVRGPDVCTSSAFMQFAWRLREERLAAAGSAELMLGVDLRNWLVNCASGRNPEELMYLARRKMIDALDTGLPLALYLDDPLSWQYFNDLASWSSLDASVTESQVHRELASGLPSAVGFNCRTHEQSIQVAVDAVRAASRPHHFIALGPSGGCATVQTRGNPDCHVAVSGLQDLQALEGVAGRVAQLGDHGLPGAVFLECAGDARLADAAVKALAEGTTDGRLIGLGLTVSTGLEPGEAEPESALRWERCKTLLQDIRGLHERWHSLA